MVRDRWKQALADAVRDPETLLEALELPASLRARVRGPSHEFPLLVPRDFLARMRPRDVADPLLRQVLPLRDEEIETPGYVTDPVGDRAAAVSGGVLHKYRGRVLLVTAGVCAVHCRYCFRKEFPYAEAPKGVEAWLPVLEQVRSDASIEEVILSGGDPLLWTDAALERLVRALEGIAHLRRLRIHTRVPIVIPERVTPELVALLAGTRLATFFVVHTNHAQELEGACVDALGELARAGVPLLNQSVLLRGVNDDEDALAALSTRLVNLQVMPYYLHQLDRVIGTAHFFVPESKGLGLVRALRARLPGYAVPRYVREVPGEPSKIEIGSADDASPVP